MKRVKFLKTTGQYASGAIVTLPDADADKAIEMRDAVAGDEIQSVGNEPPKFQNSRRVIFLKQFKHGEQTWQKDARMFVPDPIADAAIKAGAAKPFPIPSVGDEPPAKIKREKISA